MDNLHAAQMELNKTIEETHHLQSSQSVLLQVLEAEFEHFITDHWCPMQAIVQHSRVHLPCTCPLQLAAQCPSPSPSSSGCPLPQRCLAPEPGSGSDSFFTALEIGCHHHGHLTQLSLNSFLYFTKSNSSHPLIDLIFPLILSIHVTLILSYPSLHNHYLTFLIFLQRRWFIL